MKALLFSILALLSFSLHAQSDEDDETVYQLKKGIYPFIDSNLLIKSDGEKKVFLRGNNSFLYGCNAPFLHGVASGDPTANAVIIWTRWTPPTDFTGVKPIQYQVAESIDFSQIQEAGIFYTDSSIDYTVKVDVTNLQEDKIYFYRFFTDTDTSIIGRTKTLSLTNENARLAFVNCNDYTKGYYNAFKALADRNDVDAVVHLGDYIYEQGGGVDDRQHDPFAEVWRLNDYRTRFSQYKLDNYLSRCHQLYPFIQIWDDHDIVVDAVSDTSLRHQAQYGSYHVRRWAAVKAFREWNPVRDDSTNFIKNWRKFSFGSTVDVFMVDDRLYERDRIPTSTSDTLYNSVYAKMLGQEQINWLINSVSQSTAKWKIIANGLMFSQLQVAGTPLVLENWDGYSFERNKIFQLIKSQNIKNVIVYSGDFHCAFAINLSDNPYNFLNYNPLNGNGSLAVEFIPPSASSDNFDEGNDFGLGAGNSALAENLIKTSNTHVQYVDLTHHGFSILDLSNDRAQNEFWYVNTLWDPNDNSVFCGNVSTVNFNSNKISGGSNPLPNGNIGEVPNACFVNTANIQELTNASKTDVISCFPSPFSNAIGFQILGAIGNQYKVELFDVFGKKVHDNSIIQSEVVQQFTIEIDKKLSSGIYIIRIHSKNFEWNKRLVKE